MTSPKPAEPVRNPGTDFHGDWLDRDGFDPATAQAGARALADGAAGPPPVEAARLVQAVRLLDLTTLGDRDTADTVRLLCADALEPLGPAPSHASGQPQDPVRVAAVCVYDRFVPVARSALAGTGVRVAAVTAGFPDPLPSRARRLEEIRSTVDGGADEIDAVITREYALEGDWAALHEEVRHLRAACGGARLKMILRAGTLGDLESVRKAALVCCMAGADFVKTSTGRETVNATLPVGLAMTAAIRAYAARTGHAVGFKPAGGIRSPEDALSWLRLVQQELGEAWLTPSYLRIGASSLLGRIRERLGALGPAEP